MGVPICVRRIYAPAFDFQKRDSGRAVHVSGAATLHLSIGMRGQNPVQPMIVTQANAHDYGGSA